MPRTYGPLHTVGEFVGRCLPKRGGNATAIRHAQDVIAGLSRLDECQRKNRAVTLLTSAGGGIWVTHNGQRLFMIEPGQAALSTLLSLPGDWLAEIYAPYIKSGAVEERLGTERYRSWKIKAGHLDIIWSIVEGLSQPDPAQEVPEGEDPRDFPGAARQAALEAFQASGNFCPGYKRKRHRVNFDDGEGVEFDHILPHSAGGASSD